jgi:hypothetical protein
MAEEARVDEGLHDDDPDLADGAHPEHTVPFAQQNTPEQNALIDRLKATLEPLIAAHPDPQGNERTRLRYPLVV